MAVSRTSQPYLYTVSNPSLPLFGVGGDTVIEVGGYRSHLFTTVGTRSFSITQGSGEITYLIVAGGGGTLDGGGGGGAGGYLTGVIQVSQGPYTFVVGDGGTGGASPTNGSNSTGFGLTAIGGGRSAGGSVAGSSGGSGGGGGSSDGSYAGGAGTAGQGNNGGIGAGTAGLADNGGGGGGGAGAAGSNRPGNGNGGAGGVGLANSLSGSLTYYSGGGGGTQHSSPYTAGAHGLGEGPNTGGGGTGDYNTSGENAGDSGIVIVRYAYA